MKKTLYFTAILAALTLSACGGAQSRGNPNQLDQATYDKDQADIRKQHAKLATMGCTFSDFEGPKQEVKCADDKPLDTARELNSYAHRLNQFITRYTHAVLPNGKQYSADDMKKFQSRYDAVRKEQDRLQKLINQSLAGASPSPTPGSFD